MGRERPAVTAVETPHATPAGTVYRFHRVGQSLGNSAVSRKKRNGDRLCPPLVDDVYPAEWMADSSLTSSASRSDHIGERSIFTVFMLIDPPARIPHNLSLHNKNNKNQRPSATASEHVVSIRHGGCDARPLVVARRRVSAYFSLLHRGSFDGSPLHTLRFHLCYLPAALRARRPTLLVGSPARPPPSGPNIR